MIAHSGGNTRHPLRTQAQGWMDAGWKVDKVGFGFGVRFKRYD